MEPINTPRLQLVPLSLTHLEMILAAKPVVERELGMPISAPLLDGNVCRAIGIKCEKMRVADPEKHGWFTYWLIVVTEEHMGAGLIGFKGIPNAQGETEIGYGIDPAYQNKGYMTEATRALVEWAFAHPECAAITATTVANPASNRVLEKLAAQIRAQNMETTDWVMVRTKLCQRRDISLQ